MMRRWYDKTRMCEYCGKEFYCESGPREGLSQFAQHSHSCEVRIDVEKQRKEDAKKRKEQRKEAEEQQQKLREKRLSKISKWYEKHSEAVEWNDLKKYEIEFEGTVKEAIVRSAYTTFTIERLDGFVLRTVRFLGQTNLQSGDRVRFTLCPAKPVQPPGTGEMRYAPRKIRSKEFARVVKKIDSNGRCLVEYRSHLDAVVKKLNSPWEKT